MIEHTREARHIVDVISDWGGLHGILFTLMGVVVGAFNEELKKAKFIRNIFV
jgi:hypothetical protein